MSVEAKGGQEPAHLVPVYLLLRSKQDLGLPRCLSGEGNGNPLQYSCLENPKDSGAWWAAV